LRSAPLDNKMSTNGILVYIEIDHDQIATVSLELISKARDLADELGVEVSAIMISDGENKDNAAPFSYGCDHLYRITDTRLKFYETLPYTNLTAQLIRRIEPQIVLFGATPIGRDLAPRVASSLKTGLTADCTDLQIQDHEDRAKKKLYKNILFQIRPAFGGNIIATIISPDHRPQMATVREGVMKLGRANPKRKGQLIELPSELSESDFHNQFIDRLVGRRRINLNGADIIVAGGAGVGGKKQFKLVHELAETLGGMVGASRAAVDNGYIDAEHQVGQTGTTVRPKLYIACGISGCVQHQAGMDQSGKIIAINTDPDAPIFNIAHYGIVGDLNQVIPMMIKSYKAKE